jgi:Peptidase family M50
MDGELSPNHVRAKSRPKREPTGWEAFFIRFLTGFVIAFFGLLFCGIAWLVYQSTLVGSPPEFHTTSAAMIALLGGYLLFLGLRKMVKRPNPLQPPMPEMDKVRIFYMVAGCALAAVMAVSKPLTVGYLGPVISFFVYAGMLFLAIFLVILVHELGHYLAALAVGRQPVEFSIGDGRKLWETKRDKLQITLRLIPSIGHVAVDDGERWSRAGLIFFAAAGPLATLLLGFVVWMIEPAMIASLLSEPLESVVIALRSGMLKVIGFSIVFSLVPTKYIHAGRPVPSDGTLILSGLFPLRSW